MRRHFFLTLQTLISFSLLTGCMQSDVQIIKSAIEKKGYNLESSSCPLSADNINGYKKGECYAFGPSLHAEFYTLDKGSSAVNAVASHIIPQKEYYFRQVAAGKVWFLLKGKWEQKAFVDSLMDDIHTALSE